MSCSMKMRTGFGLLVMGYLPVPPEARYVCVAPKKRGYLPLLASTWHLATAGFRRESSRSRLSVHGP